MCGGPRHRFGAKSSCSGTVGLVWTVIRVQWNTCSMYKSSSLSRPSSSGASNVKGTEVKISLTLNRIYSYPACFSLPLRPRISIPNFVTSINNNHAKWLVLEDQDEERQPPHYTGRPGPPPSEPSSKQIHRVSKQKKGRSKPESRKKAISSRRCTNPDAYEGSGYIGRKRQPKNADHTKGRHEQQNTQTEVDKKLSR
jgi:hypothetical protein